VQLSVSNSLSLGVLFGLAILSVGLKAAAGPDTGLGPPGAEIADKVARSLQAQGFSTNIQIQRSLSSVVYAKRNDCRLTVRDAREGAAVETLFESEAVGVGTVRYLYRGKASDAPPASAMWADRVLNKVLNGLRIQRRIPVPLALATSPGCGGQDFGLSDFRV
jgi:hypothetical protein